MTTPDPPADGGDGDGDGYGNGARKPSGLDGDPELADLVSSDDLNVDTQDVPAPRKPVRRGQTGAGVGGTGKITGTGQVTGARGPSGSHTRRITGKLRKTGKTRTGKTGKVSARKMTRPANDGSDDIEEDEMAQRLAELDPPTPDARSLGLEPRTMRPLGDPDPVPRTPIASPVPRTPIGDEVPDASDRAGEGESTGDGEGPAEGEGDSLPSLIPTPDEYPPDAVPASPTPESLAALKDLPKQSTLETVDQRDLPSQSVIDTVDERDLSPRDRPTPADPAQLPTDIVPRPGTGGPGSLGGDARPSASGESVVGYVSETRGVSAAIDLANPARPDLVPASVAEGRGQRYVNIVEIARGGMGSIRIGFDRDIRREVAMKIILGGTHSPTDKQARFLEEAQITGQLEHPNIVPVHDLGIDPDGSLFFTMKYVRGESLLDVIQRTRDQHAGHERHFTLTRMLQIFLKVCDAVSFAHSRGVIHRDLKPENVMVGGYGEVLVMDWGLSKVLGRPDHVRSRLEVTTDRSEGGLVRTHDGSIVGTPGHMPPEQARGELDQLDERSDIYALGCLLYEMLTFEPPFPGNDVAKLIKAVRRGRFIPPTQLAPERNIPRELEEVVMNAMAFRKEDRYATVRDLSTDIEAFLEGRTLRSVSYTPTQLVTKWVRRNIRAAGLAILVVTVCTVLAGWAVWAAMTDRDAARRKVADLENEISRLANAPPTDPAAIDAERRRARHAGLLAAADAALADRDPERARQRLRQAASLRLPENRLETALHTRLERLLHRGLQHMVTGEAVSCIAVDDSGYRVAAGSRTGRIFTWDLREESRNRTGPVFRHQQPVMDLCFVNGDLIIGDNEGVLTRLDSNGRELQRVNTGVQSIRGLTAAGNAVVAGDRFGRLIRVPVPFTESAMMLPVAARATAVTFSESLMAYGTDQGIVYIASRKNVRRPLSTADTGLGIIRRLVFDRTGTYLIAVGSRIAVYHVTDDDDDSRRQPLRTAYRLPAPRTPTGGVALDGRQRIWVGTRGGLDVFALSSGAFLGRFVTERDQDELPAAADPASGIGVTLPSHNGLIAIDRGGRLLVLDNRPDTAPLIVPGLTGPIRIAISRNGRNALAIDGSRVVAMASHTGYQPVGLVTPSAPTAVAFAPDGRHAYIACENGELLVHSAGEDAALPTEPDPAGRKPVDWDLVETGVLGTQRILVHAGGMELFFVGERSTITRVVLDETVGTFQANKVYTLPGPRHAGATALWSAGHRLLMRPMDAGGVELLTAPAGESGGKVLIPLGPDGPCRATALALPTPGLELLVGDELGRLHLLTGPSDSPADWKVQWTLEAVSAGPVTRIVMVPGHEVLLTVDAAGEVRAWHTQRLAPPEPLGTLSTGSLSHGPDALALILRPDGTGDVWYPVAGHGCPLGSLPLRDLTGDPR